MGPSILIAFTRGGKAAPHDQRNSLILEVAASETPHKNEMTGKNFLVISFTTF